MQLCPLGIDNAKEMCNYGLILLSSDGNLISSRLKAVILKNLTQACEGFHHFHSFFFPQRYESVQSGRLYKLIMQFKQLRKVPGGHTLHHYTARAHWYVMNT